MRLSITTLCTCSSWCARCNTRCHRKNGCTAPCHHQALVTPSTAPLLRDHAAARAQQQRAEQLPPRYLTCPQHAQRASSPYVCMYECMYVCMHAYVHTYIHVCMHACMHACMYVCRYACMHACMHACMYTHTRTHTHTHTHTPTPTQPPTQTHTNAHAHTDAGGACSWETTAC